MGEGQLLLKLQETDLELVRHRSELNALPRSSRLPRSANRSQPLRMSFFA